MGTHKLLLDNDYGYDFTLIAIHTSLEAFQTAFLLNKHLGLSLSRSTDDLILHRKNYQVDFSLFEYKDVQSHVTFHLFNNRTIVTLQEETQGLFNNQKDLSLSEFFLADLPQVDYLIKVCDDSYAFAKAQTLKTIKDIPQIVTAYNVDIDQLKTKQNLIFE